MRKNSPRKWLHACLDLLPVILIPVFMIYSHRHTLTERTDVDIQYKYQSNEVNSLSDVVESNIYYFDNQNSTMDNFYDEGGEIELELIELDDYDFSSFDDTFSLNEWIDYGCGVTKPIIKFYFDGSYHLQITISFVDSDYFVSFEVGNTGSFNFILKGIFKLINALDLNYYACWSYTTYNEIESVSVNDTNSDIMSVFMDDFNNAIDKYFNMGNVFNLDGVYQWFNINIFSGNAPTIIYSIWNIALYELVMDLLFLLYGLFMWFIDMVQYLMEKPFKSIK